MTLIAIGSATDLGQRESNEDSLLAVASQDSTSFHRSKDSLGASALLILADGMGGRAGGQIASQTAVRVCYRELAHVLVLKPEAKREYVEKVLRNALRQANTRIQSLSNGNSVQYGMGTTCTVAVVLRDAISLAHVGDSRAYLLTEDGPLEALTVDHSVVNEEIRAGRLTEEEARRSKFRNVITRAVGVEANVTADILWRALPAGKVSRIVVSSDGLHGTLNEDQIKAILNANPDPQDAAEVLVAEAKAGGAADNISVIVARVETNPASEAQTSETPESERRRVRNPQPEGVRWNVSGSNIIAFAAGFLAMAAIVLAVGSHFGFRGAIDFGAEQNSLFKPSSQINLSTATYGAPQSLLGRPVVPSVLMAVGADLVVVDPAAHRVLRVRSTDGHVLTSTPDTSDLAALPPQSSYWAVDAQGDVYESQSTPPQVRKFGPDGLFIRTVGQGVLHSPQAVAVAPSGDIFVIDGGVLKRLPVSALDGPAGSGQ
jgi:protein phosphatase